MKRNKIGNLEMFSVLIGIFIFFQCKNERKNAVVSSTESTEKLGTLFEVNTDQSILYWIGSTVLKSHNGTLKLKDGRLEIDQNGQLKSGTFHIDMQSIVNLDIVDSNDKKDLEDHLKSADFLAIDTFPLADFYIKEVNPISDSLSNCVVKGDLTVRGITEEIQIKVKVIYSGNSAMIVIPEFSIDRTKWNINYHSSKIVNLVKDKLINDEVKLSIKIIAVKK